MSRIEGLAVFGEPLFLLFCGLDFFAVLISDATACCAQGIEFVPAGEHMYPYDYPAIGDEIVIHGTFNTYEDETGAYVQLKDAVLE